MAKRATDKSDKTGGESEVDTSPRKIVLFSDGTGNASSSINKSNIWRIFQALDTGPASPGMIRQLAFYDDGVGTSGFRPWQMLAQAFGFGLFRNVKQLYGELCRHYEPGDEVFLFGFSRGAFTVRVLAHLICVCGILDRSRAAPNAGGAPMSTEFGLERGVRDAYKAYRHLYWSESANGWLRFLGWVLRSLRGLFRKIYDPKQFSAAFSYPFAPAGKGPPLIRFVGVFDTVDAHGLPIEELSDALNQLFYPYKFPDFRLNERVGHARQALAVDDERHTFTPLLWDESLEKDRDRIRQVWFAGMHADIGGGYPEDNLSFAPLVWMMEEAAKSGLRFQPAELDAYRAAAQPTAKMHDSRRGVAVYYRYRPREISKLVDHNGVGTVAGLLPERVRGVLAQRDLRVHAGVPLVHHSVIRRISDRKVGYAPTAIDCKFDICLQNATIEAPGETPDVADARTALMARAAGHIFWRRVCYYGMLAPSLFLGWIALSHWWHPIAIQPVPDYWQSPIVWALQTASGWFSGFPMGLIGTALEGWAARPNVFIICGLVGAGFYFWGNIVVTRNMVAITENGWGNLKLGLLPSHPVAPGPYERLATAFLGSRLRTMLREVWRAVLTTAFALFGFLVFWYSLAALVPLVPWPDSMPVGRFQFWSTLGGLLLELWQAASTLLKAIPGMS